MLEYKNTLLRMQAKLLSEQARVVDKAWLKIGLDAAALLPA